MSFLRCLGIILMAAALLLSISCEKHHVGEYPEVQKDLTATLDKEASNPEPGGSAAPTPVKFFSDKKSP
jgi:predicted component of type VI protein secretion system